MLYYTHTHTYIYIYIYIYTYTHTHNTNRCTASNTVCSTTKTAEKPVHHKKHQNNVKVSYIFPSVSMSALAFLDLYKKQ